MMRIPFTLIDNNGDPMLGKASDAIVQLSHDGLGFVDAQNEVHETGSGCYYIDLTPDECNCTYYVNIKITIDGGQMTVLQYTPDTDPDDIADAVWENGHRTLTSLNVDKPALDFIPKRPTQPSCPHHHPPLKPCRRW